MVNTVFRKKYAHAYDYLYQDKDYKKECDFLENIFKKHKKINTILDLGCGTGSHAIILAERGYKVSGVERSKEMLAYARRKIKNAGFKIALYKSSIQDLSLNKTFDAVISMFAVMSYQIGNYEVALACKKAQQHLKQGGVFIFDAWNGFAVLADPPTYRVKEVINGDERIIRFTKPEINLLHHTVDINFKVLILKKGVVIAETEEVHKMRFFFPQEIKYLLETAGFTDIKFCPFLQFGAKLSPHDWNMTVIAK